MNRYDLSPASESIRRRQDRQRSLFTALAVLVMGLGLVAVMVAILALGMIVGTALGIDLSVS